MQPEYVRRYRISCDHLHVRCACARIQNTVLGHCIAIIIIIMARVEKFNAVITLLYFYH